MGFRLTGSAVLATGLLASRVETLTGRGTATLALGAAKPLSAACRSVAKLAKS